MAAAASGDSLGSSTFSVVLPPTLAKTSVDCLKVCGICAPCRRTKEKSALKAPRGFAELWPRGASFGMDAQKSSPRGALWSVQQLLSRMCCDVGSTHLDRNTSTRLLSVSTTNSLSW